MSATILKRRAVALINPQVQELIIAATYTSLARLSNDHRENINAEIDAQQFRVTLNRPSASGGINQPINQKRFQSTPNSLPPSPPLSPFPAERKTNSRQRLRPVAEIETRPSLCKKDHAREIHLSVSRYFHPFVLPRLSLPCASRSPMGQIIGYHHGPFRADRRPRRSRGTSVSLHHPSPHPFFSGESLLSASISALAERRTLSRRCRIRKAIFALEALFPNSRHRVAKRGVLRPSCLAVCPTSFARGSPSSGRIRDQRAPRALMNARMSEEIAS